MGISIEQVEKRMSEITAFVADARKQIDTVTQEYNQLLGYKQALLDLENKVTEETVLNEAKTTKKGA